MKKNTKKSLFFSITALILCCALLAGTTFAWFTDTATSGVNTIQAGNLDVEVAYKQPGGSWATIEGTNSLFTSDKWEPGHTEVVYLRVKNAGTLGLNYKVLVTPVSENGGVNVNGESFKLSDYLVFGTTEPSETEKTYTREEARTEVGAGTGLNGDVNSLTKSNTILADGADKYLALVVYMPESIGNVANHKTGTTAPTIDLGIKVVATQLQAENDSFGNDYDKNAVTTPVYAGGAYYNYFEAVNETATADGDGNFTVTKTDANTGIIASASGTAAAGAKVNLVVTKTSVSDGNFGIAVDEGHELNGYDIKVTGQTENTLVKGKLYVGTGLENFKFYHNGEVMTDGTQDNLANGEYYYSKTDGFVYFATETFSPFQATYKAPAASITNSNGTAVYGTLADAVAAAKNGDTVVLLKDVTLTETLTVNKTITLDLNTKTVSGSNSTNIYMTTGILTVKNGVIDVSGEAFRVNGKDNTTDGSLELNLESNVTVKSSDDCCVYIYGLAILNTEAKLYNSSEFTTIQTHGNHNTTVVNVLDGVVENQAGPAIYFANGKALTISGGELTGTTAVAAKGGIVTISDGAVLHATGEKDDPTEAENSGTNDTGDAFYIEDNYTPAVTANITGGTFISDNAKAVNILFKQEQKGSTINITGGTFSSDPNEFCADGYCALPEGNMYQVIEGCLVSNRDELVAAANGTCETIYLKNDFNVGSTVTLNRDVTLDGRGCTLTAYYANPVIDIRGAVDVTLKNTNIKFPSYTKSEGVRAIGTGNKLTFENVNITNAFKAIHFSACKDTVVSIKGCNLTSVYPFNVNGGNVASFVVEDSSLNGWTSFSNSTQCTYQFKNCSFGMGKGYATVKPYGNTTFEGCTFSADYFTSLEGGIASGTTTPITVNFNNCKMTTSDGVTQVLTVELLRTAFNYDITSGSNSGASTINDQYWYVNGEQIFFATGAE